MKEVSKKEANLILTLAAIDVRVEELRHEQLQLAPWQREADAACSRHIETLRYNANIIRMVLDNHK